MTIMYEEDVKTGLEKYRCYQNEIRAAKELIEVIEAKKGSCGGSIARKPQNPKPHEKVILDRMEMQDDAMKAINAKKYFIDLADEFIQSLPSPYNEIVIMKYIEGNSSRIIGELFGYHERSIYKLIESLIAQFSVQKRRKL